jgi:hypothetical protein
MPKRPDAKRVRAAVAAGDPPKSADYPNPVPDDDDCGMSHDAQHEWLAKWSVRVLLDGPLRRRQWDDRVQEHKRLEAAAAKGGTQPPTPKRKYARRPAVPIAHKPVLAGPPRSKRPLPLSTPAYELAMGKYAVARDARRKLPRLRLCIVWLAREVSARSCAFGRSDRLLSTWIRHLLSLWPTTRKL